MSLDSAWQALESEGAYSSLRRVDESHPSDFFAAFDARGARGLVLFSGSDVGHLPALKSLELESLQLPDGKWQTSIWLRAPELQMLFCSLCEDMVSASRDVPVEEIAEFVHGRLVRWQRLLELADGALLRLEEIRGLVGELLVMRDCFRIRPLPEVIAAWSGPLGAPQDFAFADALIETKAVGPTALRVRVSSADQLDAPYSRRLTLAVVRVASSSKEQEGGFTLSQLIAQIALLLDGLPSSGADFRDRLAAAGYAAHPDYDLVRFRNDGINYFEIQPGFPRICRADLMHGIDNVRYDIELATISGFERPLEAVWN
jgi:hypothetical protein